MLVRFAYHRLSLYRGPALAGVLALMLNGCATLPISGPTRSQIVKDQKDPQSGLHFRLVEVEDFSALPLWPKQLAAPIDSRPVLPTDLIGPGDILSVSVYETGVPLFAATGSAGALAGSSDMGGGGGGAHVTNLAPFRVDDNGDIRFPFIGRMHAAGLTPSALEAKVRSAMRGMSQDPQVVISIAESLTNSVMVGGEVSKSGRLTLQTNRETVADVVSLAGGYRGDSKDLLLRVERQGQTQDFRLSDVMTNPGRNMIARPGDRIDIIRQPLSFSVMGGAGRVEQLPFSAPAMTLAEAVAASGGASPNYGDAKAIFVFRMEVDADGRPLPTVYHLNMLRAGSLFLAQRFAMQDKDVLYIGNAAFNQPSKLIQAISQLFSPVVAVASGASAVR